MSKLFRIIAVAFIGFFFSIATLEIDVFGYDNTFFDTYDSYVQVDIQLVHQSNNLELDYFVIPKIHYSTFSRSVILLAKGDEFSISPHPQNRKLYIVKSSLLI